jgi:hypothetical protein
MTPVRFTILLTLIGLVAAPAALASEGIAPEVHAPEVVPGSEGLLEPLNKIGPSTVYPYYPLLTLEVQRLADEYPDLVRLSSAGQSVLGLELWMLEIADFGNPDMKPLEDREVVYIDGGTHSNEYSAVYFVTEIAQFLVEEYESNETAQWIVENRHTFIIPMVNPDGSNAMGRLNANLVNINRNFPVLWGALDELAVLNDPGPYPASEPETQAVIRVINDTRPDYLATIHCCGNLWLYPYGVEGLDPLDNQSFARVCDEVFASVRDDCGPIWSTIYPASGSTTDTAYEYVGASAWGFEMSGRGNVAPWGQPFTLEDVRVQERESWDAVMHAFLNVHKYGAHPELVGLTGSPRSLTVTVENTGYGPLLHGNVTVGDARVTLPVMDAGETASVTVDGAFTAGTTPVSFDWQKRIMAAPQGAMTVTVDLVEAGRRLVAVTLEDGTRLDAAGPGDAEGFLGVPAPGLLAAAVAAALAAGAARRAARP